MDINPLNASLEYATSVDLSQRIQVHFSGLIDMDGIHSRNNHKFLIRAALL